MKEHSPTNHSNTKEINNDEHEDNSSVDTNDMFMEMLGFSSSDRPESLNVAEIIYCDEEESSIKRTTACLASCKPIKVPKNCARSKVDPSNCLGLVLDNVLTEEDCRRIIQMAEETGFRYITEATHKTDDGSTSYTVEIQKPNPHKLCAVDTHHHHNPQLSLTDRLDDDDNSNTLLMDHLYDTLSTSLAADPSYQSFANRTQCGSMQGLNRRMRILKYDARDNDRFDAHFDATTYVPGLSNDRRRKSLITVLVYLNNSDGDDFEGGETLFLPKSKPGDNTRRTNQDNAVKVTPKTGRVVVFEHDLFHSGAPLHQGTKYVMRTDILFHEIQEDTPKVDKPDHSTMHEPNNTVLVSELCAHLKFAAHVMLILRNMDLFDITCESLLAPGATLVRHMLLDCNLDVDSVTLLINEASKAIIDN